MTDHELAELLDPEHKRAGWWNPGCVVCGGRLLGPKGSMFCSYGHMQAEGVPIYTGPPLTTDDLAAFRYVRPVLLAAGCEILSQPRVNQVTCPLMDGFEVFPRNPLDAAYAAATTAAIAWLRDNQPETLNRAIAQAVIK